MKNLMKKRWIAYFLVWALIATAITPLSTAKHSSAAVKLTGKTKSVAYSQTAYGQHGKLRVSGTKLVDKQGKTVQLRGISSHGINWDVGEPFVNEKALQNLRDEWGVNCFRVA
ncbi:MAG: glycoside hydrolase family 5 protein, partial [Lachnospiraceae bacterium]|nr:glycoside hydrolase family 5 protein [Lachnospiraceae bacterium]